MAAGAALARSVQTEPNPRAGDRERRRKQAINVRTVGRLTRDPELHDTRAGAVWLLRIAVDNPGRGGQRSEPTYVDVAAFGKHAEACVTQVAAVQEELTF